MCDARQAVAATYSKCAYEDISWSMAYLNICEQTLFIWLLACTLAKSEVDIKRILIVVGERIQYLFTRVEGAEVFFNLPAVISPADSDTCSKFLSPVARQSYVGQFHCITTLKTNPSAVYRGILFHCAVPFKAFYFFFADWNFNQDWWIFNIRIRSSFSLSSFACCSAIDRSSSRIWFSRSLSVICALIAGKSNYSFLAKF